MKILVCTDGSQESLKAVEKAAEIADGCKVDEVSVIYVYEKRYDVPPWGGYYHPTQVELNSLNEGLEDSKKESRKSLVQALSIFEAKNIKANAIFEEGHAADMIVKVASEGEFDLIVLGRRGTSGLEKLFLGSVSNAVLQEANTSVLIVK